MLTFLGKRLLQLIPTLFFVSVMIFLLLHLLPGDPALAIAGEERDPAVLAQIRAQYHLDESWARQYIAWVGGVLHGDLGESIRMKESVRNLVAAKLPVTFQLAVMAIVIGLSIGLTAGVVAAVKKDSAWDYAAGVFALWGRSTPSFWLGIMLIFLFAVKLDWLPASGYVPPSEGLLESLASTIMPAFVLGNVSAAVLMRHTRSAMLDALNSDYVRTARAKGLSERRVVYRHGLRAALTPVVSQLGIDVGALLGGVIVVEQVFGLSGLGQDSVQAIDTGNLPVIIGFVLIASLFVVVANIIVDAAYALLDPRVRIS
jgi:peptide/nickel transport system permease protein